MTQQEEFIAMLKQLKQICPEMFPLPPPSGPLLLLSCPIGNGIEFETYWMPDGKITQLFCGYMQPNKSKLCHLLDEIYKDCDDVSEQQIEKCEPLLIEYNIDCDSQMEEVD